MFGSVVLALDGSESSDPALECATGLAKLHTSNVHVVRVVELAVGEKKAADRRPGRWGC